MAEALVTDRDRKRAFVATVALIAALAAVLSLTGPGRDEGDAVHSGEDVGAAADGDADVYPAPAVPDAAGDASTAGESPALSVESASTPDDASAAGTDVRGDAEGPLAGTPRDRTGAPSAALRAAEGFVEVFLRYESGESSGSVRRGLSSHAERGFVSELRATPPRLPRGIARPPRGRLVSIRPAGDAPEGGLLLTATVDYEGRRTEILLTLRREGGSWLVADLG